MVARVPGAGKGRIGRAARRSGMAAPAPAGGLPSALAEGAVGEEVLQVVRLGAPVLLGRAHLRPEFGRRVPGPAQVVEQGAGEGDRIRLAVLQDRLGLGGLRDQADGDGGKPGLGLDARREGHLVARPHGDCLFRREAAGGDVDRRGAPGLQGLGQGEGALEVPAARDPVRGRDAHPDRASRRHRRAHRLEAFEGEAHPVLQGAAIGVAAGVGERREELVQQVAMGPVQLHPVDPEAHRPPGGGDEAVADALEVGEVEGVRGHLARPVGDRRGRLRAPALGMLGRDLRAPVPGGPARGLAPGMGDLEGDGHGRVFPHRAEHPGERPLGGVVVEAEIPGGDARLGADRRRLQGQEPGPRGGELAEMHHMPIGRRPVPGGVLAHRRDEDAVLEHEIVEPQGLEQARGGHGGSGVFKITHKYIVRW